MKTNKPLSDKAKVILIITSGAIFLFFLTFVIPARIDDCASPCDNNTSPDVSCAAVCGVIWYNMWGMTIYKDYKL